MKKKTFLVTGGTGFIGSNITNYLVSKNYNVLPNRRCCYSIATRHDKIRYDADSNFLNCMLLLVCCVISDTFITSIFYINL